MYCSTDKKATAGRIKQDYGASGILYDIGGVYDRLCQLTDIRKARGKLYSLDTILMIILLAKLCGEDRPSGMADWAKNHQEPLVQLLQLKRAKMPSHSTYRRILAQVVCQEEIERLVGE